MARRGGREAGETVGEAEGAAAQGGENRGGSGKPGPTFTFTSARRALPAGGGRGGRAKAGPGRRSRVRAPRRRLPLQVLPARGSSRAGGARTWRSGAAPGCQLGARDAGLGLGAGEVWASAPEERAWSWRCTGALEAVLAHLQ